MTDFQPSYIPTHSNLQINNRIESFSTFIDLLHQDFGRHQNTNLLSYHANYLTPLALPKVNKPKQYRVSDHQSLDGLVI